MKYFSIIGLLFLIFSCAEKKEATPKKQKEPVEYKDTAKVMLDTITEVVPEVKEYEKPIWCLDSAGLKVLTIGALVEGPDADFYIPHMAIEKYGDSSPDFDLLHIVPFADEDYKREEHEIEHYFAVIAQEYNSISGDFFKESNGNAVVFYDREKTKIAAHFNIIEGKKNAELCLYTPEGELHSKRIYKEDKWVSSEVEPYSVGWEFNQETGLLRINAEDAKVINDTLVYELMNYPRFGEEKYYSLYNILEKKSYENDFKVNGELFSGRINGYFEQLTTNEELPYFTLNFKDGKLHGDIYVYSEWGTLQLKEKFVNGEMTEQVYKAEYEGEMAKPIIYLYPEKDMDVEVKLNLAGNLTHTYPKYNKGWKVKAKPDGTLLDENGKEYYALYWEGKNKNEFTLNEGFVVSGEETITFLEEKLAYLGLNRREANEFIVYWLPQMENNKYNLVHFSTVEYEQEAQLNITPKPDNLIRIMMVFKPLNSKINIKPQALIKAPVRSGFTVVEWGGQKLSNESDLLVN